MTQKCIQTLNKYLFSAWSVSKAIETDSRKLTSYAFFIEVYNKYFEFNSI